MNNGGGSQPNDHTFDFSSYSGPKLEPPASPPAYIDPALASQASSNGDSPSDSQALPTAGPAVDPNREQTRSRWSEEDEAEVLEWTPLYFKAGKGFEDIGRALTNRRSATAVKARWNKLAEGKEEFAHLVTRRKRSRTTTEEGSDRASSSTPGPAQEVTRAKAEPIEVSVKGEARSYGGYGFQAAERLPTPSPWDIDEDARLTTAVLLRGEDDWEKIRQEIQPSTRTAQELRERWFTVTKTMNKTIQQSGMWSVPLPNLHALLAATPGFDQPAHLFINSDRKYTPVPPYFSAPATDAMHQRTSHQAQLIAREAASTSDPRHSPSPSQSNNGTTNHVRVPAYSQTFGNFGSLTSAQQHQPQQIRPSSAPSLPAAEDRARALVAAHAAAQLQPRPPHPAGGAIPPFVNKPSPLATSTILSANGSSGPGWGGGGVPSISAGNGAALGLSNGSRSSEGHESRSLGGLPPMGRAESAPRRSELPPLPGTQPSDFKLPPMHSLASVAPPASASTPSTPVHFQPRPLPISFPHQQTSSAQTPTTQPPFPRQQHPTSAEQAQRQLLSRVPGAVAGGSTSVSAPPSLERTASFNYDMFNTPIAPVNALYTLPRTQSTPALSFYSQSTSNNDTVVASSQGPHQSWTPAPSQSFHHQSNTNAPLLPILSAPAPQQAASSLTTAESTIKGPTPPATPRARSTRAASQKAGDLMQKLVKESQDDDDEEEDDDEHEEWGGSGAAKSKARRSAKTKTSEELKELDITIAETEPMAQAQESEEDGSDDEWDGDESGSGERRGGRKKGSATSSSAAIPAKKRARTLSESSLSSAMETDEARTPAEGEKLGGVGEEEEEIEVDAEEEKTVKKAKLDSPRKEPSFPVVVGVAQEEPKASSQESA